MMNILAIWLFAAGVADANSLVAPFPIALQKPDHQTLGTIKAVLADRAKEMKPFPVGRTNILSSWVKLSDSAQPYLFVELVDAYHCANVNCELYGFERAKTGWRQVFIASGEKWTVLASSTAAHHDIAQMMHGGATSQDTSIFRWAGTRYRRVSTTISVSN